MNSSRTFRIEVRPIAWADDHLSEFDSDTPLGTGPRETGSAGGEELT